VTIDHFGLLRDIVPGVSRETFDRLKQFETLLERWSSTINLVADSTRHDLWSRHILDSAQLFPLGKSSQRWLDIGSGGGFPGLVLGFLLAVQPGASIDLVESNLKKSAFLRTVVGQFALPARVNCLRVESFMPAEAPHIVTARAVASLPDLLGMAERWISNGAIGVFPKGRDYRRELEDSAHHWRFDLIEHASKTDSQGVILEVSNLRRR
jgi:16S rRNA (guanine527-N7)-methyltransferase